MPFTFRASTSTTSAAFAALLAFATGCGALPKAPSVADASKLSGGAIPESVTNVAAAAADGKVPDASSVAAMAGDVVGDKVPGGRAIAKGVGMAADAANGKAPDAAAVASLAGAKVPSAATTALSVAEGKVPEAGPAATLVRGAMPESKGKARQVAAAVPAPSAPPPRAAAAAPANRDEVASFLGASDEGWTPRALGALRRGMKPRAVAALFPGADHIDAGFSEVAVDDGFLVAKYRFFFEPRGGGQRGLRDVTIYFDKAHRSPAFYAQLVGATQKKYGAADASDVRRGSVVWVASDASIAELTRDKQGACALQVDFAR